MSRYCRWDLRAVLGAAFRRVAIDDKKLSPKPIAYNHLPQIPVVPNGCKDEEREGENK